jgi:hypothetical protein
MELIRGGGGGGGIRCRELREEPGVGCMISGRGGRRSSGWRRVVWRSGREGAGVPLALISC